MWGSVVVWNPSACFNDSKMEARVRNNISSEVSFICRLVVIKYMVTDTQAFLLLDVYFIIMSPLLKIKGSQRQ